MRGSTAVTVGSIGKAAASAWQIGRACGGAVMALVTAVCGEPVTGSEPSPCTSRISNEKFASAKAGPAGSSGSRGLAWGAASRLSARPVPSHCCR